MLLAPFSLSETTIRSRTAGHYKMRLVPLWLQVWAVGGILAITLFPSLRGGEVSGLSLPFWLIAAPLINIAWLSRSVMIGRVQGLLTSRPRGKRSGRNR